MSAARAEPGQAALPDTRIRRRSQHGGTAVRERELQGPAATSQRSLVRRGAARSHTAAAVTRHARLTPINAGRSGTRQPCRRVARDRLPDQDGSPLFRTGN